MTAITISRQFGSLGTEVAQEVAQCLEYQVIWRELINQAAHRAGAPEVALATIDDLGLLGLDPPHDVLEAYHEAVEQVMKELANEGNVVIVGRASQVILRDRPDVFHVKIIAPQQLRAERIARMQNIPIAATQAQVQASDRTRRNYLRHYYDVRWDDPELYDLIINTARLTPAAAADLICLALERCLQPGGSNVLQVEDCTKT